MSEGNLVKHYHQDVDYVSLTKEMLQAAPLSEEGLTKFNITAIAYGIEMFQDEGEPTEQQYAEDCLKLNVIPLHEKSFAFNSIENLFLHVGEKSRSLFFGTRDLDIRILDTHITLSIPYRVTVEGTTYEGFDRYRNGFLKDLVKNHYELDKVDLTFDNQESTLEMWKEKATLKLKSDNKELKEWFSELKQK